jgi:hypothetical protein
LSSTTYLPESGGIVGQRQPDQRARAALGLLGLQVVENETPGLVSIRSGGHDTTARKTVSQ